MTFADDVVVCSESREEAEEALLRCANERDPSKQVKLQKEGVGFGECS